MLHQIIYDNSYDVWNYLQSETAGHLLTHVAPNSRVLDVGCGYGALLNCFEEAKLPVNYVGLDISPDLIALANYRYGDWKNARFICCDLLWYFPDFKFDWVIVRSVENMIIENMGMKEWSKLFNKIKTLGNKLMLIEYPERVGEPLTIDIHKGV